MPDLTPEPSIPDEPKNVEAKAVILLVLLGLLIASFVLYVMYARGVFEPTQRLTLVADDSSGVIPGMDMTFAGFPIGRVRQVDLGDDGKVQITVDVQSKDAKWLRASSVFTLESSIVGETRLRAYTGVLTDEPLPPNSTRTVGRIFAPVVTAGFVLKTVMFGLAVALIPTAAVLELQRYPRALATSVQPGALRLLFVLIVIEAGSLALKYI